MAENREKITFVNSQMINKNNQSTMMYAYLSVKKDAHSAHLF